MQDWLARVGIKPIRIYPGSPWENGYNERFNGTLRPVPRNAIPAVMSSHHGVFPPGLKNLP